jgi:predicted transcriptional regulator
VEEYEAPADVLELTADIISAFVSNNKVAPEALPDLIASTYAALNNVGQPEVEPEPELNLPTAAAIRKSITDDYLVSFEDGKRYKSMKRSLSIRGLTPEEYRAKWGLPKDYPMVAPGYAAARSALAKSMGLGQGGRKPAKAPAAKPAPKGRKPKAAAE